MKVDSPRRRGESGEYPAGLAVARIDRVIRPRLSSYFAQSTSNLTPEQRTSLPTEEAINNNGTLPAFKDNGGFGPHCCRLFPSVLDQTPRNRANPWPNRGQIPFDFRRFGKTTGRGAPRQSTQGYPVTLQKLKRQSPAYRPTHRHQACDLKREPNGWLLSYDGGTTPMKSRARGLAIAVLAKKVKVDATTHSFPPYARLATHLGWRRCGGIRKPPRPHHRSHVRQLCPCD